MENQGMQVQGNVTEETFVSLGIDLGTTNSVIAVTYPNWETKAVQCPNSNGVLVPSCVQYRSRNEVVVGQSAYEMKDDPSVAYSTKVHMPEGTTYKIPIEALNGDKFEVTPVEVASHVLRHMLDAARNYFYADKVRKVTITVPAYFDDNARNNTKAAAINAGLKDEDIYLINEPTSAAIMHGITTNKKSKVLVYDLGGGTFDATLLDIEPEEESPLPSYKVGGNAGNAHLGGDNIDDIIANRVLLDAATQMPIKLSKYDEGLKSCRVIPLTLQIAQKKKLQFIAETVKKTNTNLTYGLSFTRDCIPEQYRDAFDKAVAAESVDGKSLDVTVIVTTDYVKDAVTAVFKKTLVSLKEITTKDNGFDTVVMVGGSTKSEVLRSKLRELFADKFVTSAPDPDLAVGFGASIYTYMMTQGMGSQLTDTVPLPIGVQIGDGDMASMKVIIPKDSYLPVSNGIQLVTLHDDQKTAVIKIYQGVRKYAYENAYLGAIVFENLVGAKKGDTRCELILTVDTNGILSAEALLTEVDGTQRREKKELSRILYSEDSKETKDVNSECKKIEDQLGDAQKIVYNRQKRVIESWVGSERAAQAIKMYDEAWKQELSSGKTGIVSKYVSSLRSEMKKACEKSDTSYFSEGTK